MQYHARQGRIRHGLYESVNGFHGARCRGAGLLAAMLWCALGVALAQTPPDDAPIIASGMRAILMSLDAAPALKDRSMDAFIVKAYQQAWDRKPTPEEFQNIRMLTAQYSLKRSQVLSLVLRGTEPGPTWEQCRNFLDHASAKSLESDAAAIAAADTLAREDLARILERRAEADAAKTPGTVSTDSTAEPDAPNTVYNTYFGYFHAHSGLSLDATGDPFEAYRYAREVGHLDFFSLTDHAEFLIIWPWDNKWEKLRAASDAADDPGAFAALWGFEWSNPVLGHMCIMNSSDFTNSVNMFWIGDVYNWISARPEVFAFFNHPGEYDLTHTEFLHFSLYPQAVEQLVGIEMWNIRRDFDDYYYAGSWDSSVSFYDRANAVGWRVAAEGGQDNHYADWGVMNDHRIGVLAKELTREGIAEACRARRFYSTEDKDLYLDFRSSGYAMGSRLDGTPRAFSLYARNAAGIAFQRVRLFRNGEMVREQAVTGNSIAVDFSDPARYGADYYYAIVTESEDNDGNGRNDEAISGPIWFDGDNLPAAIPACGPAAPAVTHARWADAAAMLGTALILLLLSCAGIRRRKGYSTPNAS